MFQIAVCDDDAAECRRLSRYVSDFFSLRNLPAEIDTFQSGAQFLTAEKCYDLYFFDVMMPQMSGFETARTLRKREDDPVIIFVTSSLESAVEGYSVRAAGFVLKPIQQSAFEETMNRVLKEHFERRTASIQVIRNRVPLELRLEKVAYFESRLHQVYVTLCSGERFPITHKLGDLERCLAGYPQFLRCHQSYLVNLDSVEQMEPNEFLLRQSMVAPISRNYYRQSKAAFYRHRLR
ncbi:MULTISPECIES: LytR/AlgR family response regulator transcription factor [unclassified Oscillibacter]|uniref:LytR/AlgR family response regulator transcription factor n=1 Tax=unclassified Oscillibacter TaxID=2629304 RepID=UPI0025E0511F|nr:MULTISPECIES: LytTR family DNA-binding domain-containing protein [unclassified Oscillibacter]